MRERANTDINSFVLSSLLDEKSRSFSLPLAPLYLSKVSSGLINLWQ